MYPLPPAASEALVGNYLDFLSSHRGKVTTAAGIHECASSLPGFTLAILDRPDSTEAVDGAVRRLGHARLLPGAASFEPRLRAQGLVPSGSLAFLQLPQGAVLPPGDPALRIEQATSPESIERFGDVQAASFLEGAPPEEQARWRRWLGDANQRNGVRPEQLFTVGWVEGQAVGTTLLVATRGVGGIYAVATLPSARRRGVSTALLARAVSDARARGCRTVALQVAAGSYADAFYRKLGFVQAFLAPLFSPPPGS